MHIILTATFQVYNSSTSRKRSLTKVLLSAPSDKHHATDVTAFFFCIDINVLYAYYTYYTSKKSKCVKNDAVTAFSFFVSI